MSRLLEPHNDWPTTAILIGGIKLVKYAMKAVLPDRLTAAEVIGDLPAVAGIAGFCSAEQKASLG